MPSKSTIQIVCLWEHEVRLAAKAFAHLSRLHDDDSATDDQKRDALFAAVNAGMAALAQADNDSAALVMSHVPGLVRADRKADAP